MSGTINRSRNEFEAHFWSAGSAEHLDYSLSFDMRAELLIAPGAEVQISPDYREAANRFGYAVICLLTQLEESALQLCVSDRSREPDLDRGRALDIQILEEARHLGALRKYIATRWDGPPSRCKSLDDLVSSSVFRPTVVPSNGRAMAFVENAAKALAVLLHSHACDPLLVRLSSFILADESYHSAANTLNDVDEFDAHASEMVEFLSASVKIGNYKIANADLEALIIRYAASWVSPAVWEERFGWSRISHVEMAERLNAMGATASQNAREFLQSLQTEKEPIPPAGLAVEWMIAGLRGRGPSPVSRKRWIAKERIIS